MSAFAAPIAEQIWDMKYRFKEADGTPIDATVQDSWRRIARDLASVEQDAAHWETVFYDALADFKFLPAGRITAGAGTARSVTLFNCFVMGTIPDNMGGIFEMLKEAALTMQQGGGIGYDFSTIRPKGAAVNGVAAGAGANIALSADVVIAAESAKFLQAFARIGLIPDAGGTYWLPRQMGFAKAMGAALFAEPISARQAADWGMIWEAVPDVDFDAHWRGRVAHLAKGPTAAYTAAKEALRTSFDNDLDTQLELEARLQGECGKTRDFKEGVTSFLEKRTPSYEGR